MKYVKFEGVLEYQDIVDQYFTELKIQRLSFKLLSDDIKSRLLQLVLFCGISTSVVIFNFYQEEWTTFLKLSMISGLTSITILLLEIVVCSEILIKVSPNLEHIESLYENLSWITKDNEKKGLIPNKSGLDEWVKQYNNFTDNLQKNTPDVTLMVVLYVGLFFLYLSIVFLCFWKSIIIGVFSLGLPPIVLVGWIFLIKWKRILYGFKYHFKYFYKTSLSVHFSSKK